MRIVQICPRYYPYVGGVENHVKKISERLAAKGFNVTVLTTDPSGQLPRNEEINGVKVERFPVFAPNQTIFFSRSLHKILKGLKADIIHAHGYQALTMLSVAMSKSYNRIEYITTLHLGFSKIGKWVYSFYNPIFGRYIFDGAAKIVIVSPATLSSIPLLSKYKGKIEYIPNGVDIFKIDSCLKKYGHSFDDKRLRIVSVGRLEKKKGLGVFIEALRRMEDKGLCLHVIGEGPYEKVLRGTLSNLSCKFEIKFFGRVSDEELFRNYAQSDIFVLLSEYESHSIALTEAMGFGLVPIVSNVGGNPYVVAQGVNGFLLEYPIEIQDLVDVLLLLRENREMLRKMSQNAKDTARERFDLENTVEALERVYNECSRS